MNAPKIPNPPLPGWQGKNIGGFTLHGAPMWALYDADSEGYLEISHISINGAWVDPFDFGLSMEMLALALAESLLSDEPDYSEPLSLEQRRADRQRITALAQVQEMRRAA